MVRVRVRVRVRASGKHGLVRPGRGTLRGRVRGTASGWRGGVVLRRREARVVRARRVRGRAARGGVGGQQADEDGRARHARPRVEPRLGQPAVVEAVRALAHAGVAEEQRQLIRPLAQAHL